LQLRVTFEDIMQKTHFNICYMYIDSISRFKLVYALIFLKYLT